MTVRAVRLRLSSTFSLFLSHARSCISGEEDRKNEGKEILRVKRNWREIATAEIRSDLILRQASRGFFSPSGRQARPFSLSNILALSRSLLSSPSAAWRYRVKGMQIYPLPSSLLSPPIGSLPLFANTDSRGPVPGLSICRTSDRSYASFSPCSLPNKLQGSPSRRCMHGAV